MDELVMQQFVVIRVPLCRESGKSIIVDVDFQRIEAGNEHVNTKIVLEAIYQMWIHYVLRGKYALFFVYLGSLSSQFDAASTT